MTRWVTLVCILFAATPAFAQDYAREGFSVGGGVSAAIENFDEDGGFDDTGAVSGFVGYRFLPHFGADLRFEQTFDFEADTAIGDIDVDIWSLTANAQYFFLTEQFQPYVIGGLGIAEANVSGPFDGDETDPVVRLGFGLDSYVTPSFVIGAEAAYNFGTNDLDDFDYWTLSALFRYRF